MSLYFYIIFTLFIERTFYSFPPLPVHRRVCFIYLGKKRQSLLQWLKIRRVSGIHFPQALSVGFFRFLRRRCVVKRPEVDFILPQKKCFLFCAFFYNCLLERRRSLAYNIRVCVQCTQLVRVASFIPFGSSLSSLHVCNNSSDKYLWLIPQRTTLAVPHQLNKRIRIFYFECTHRCVLFIWNSNVRQCTQRLLVFYHLVGTRYIKVEIKCFPS